MACVTGTNSRFTTDIGIPSFEVFNYEKLLQCLDIISHGILVKRISIVRKHIGLDCAV